MITFKQFLAEDEKAKTRAVNLTLEEAFELIEDHCSEWSKKFDKTGVMFYRGVEGTARVAALGDSTTGRERKSANTSNYFTWWHDNAPEWKKYPKRSRSFIGSSSHDTAANYGTVYLMIPYDSANIAVLPDEDLFSSWNGLDPEQDHTHMRSGDLSIFNEWISKIIRYNGLQEPKNYEDMVRTWKKITKEMAQSTEGDYWGEDDAKVAKTVFRESGASNMYEVWKKIFSTSRVRQFHVDDANLNGIDNQELYVQGKAVFLNPENEEVQAFAKKQGWLLEHYNYDD